MDIVQIINFLSNYFIKKYEQKIFNCNNCGVVLILVLVTVFLLGIQTGRDIKTSLQTPISNPIQDSGFAERSIGFVPYQFSSDETKFQNYIDDQYRPIFYNPETWPKARAIINFFGPFRKLLDNLENGHFDKLKKAGIAYNSIEGFVLISGSCKGADRIPAFLDLIDKINSKGGNVKYVNFDSPYAGAMAPNWHFTGNRGSEALSITPNREIYIINQQKIYKWDGNRWTLLINKGAIKDDFEFFAENNIYTIGMDGKVYHWDGKTWKKITTSGTVKDAIYITPDKKIYGIGLDGRIYKWDKNSWIPITSNVGAEGVKDDFEFFAENKIYSIGFSNITSASLPVLWDGKYWLRADACNFSNPVQVANELADLINGIKAKYPNIIFTEIEAMPPFGPGAPTSDELKNWIAEREKKGIHLPILYLDYNQARAVDQNFNTSEFLKDIKSFLEEYKIGLGIFVNDNLGPFSSAYSNKDFYNNAMNWIRLVKNAIGVPRHILFESWLNNDHRTPFSPDKNLPEAELYTFTNLIINGWKEFNKDLNSAKFISQSVPSKVAVGQTFTVSINMKNTGKTTWSNQGAGYKLGTINLPGNLTWGIGRVNLAEGEEIAPGKTKTFTFQVKAPNIPGRYNFQWQMLQEFVEVFGEPTPNVKIEVVQS